MQIKAAKLLQIGDLVKVVYFGKTYQGEICGELDRFPSSIFVDVWTEELGILRSMSTKYVRRVFFKEDFARMATNRLKRRVG